MYYVNGDYAYRWLYKTWTAYTNCLEPSLGHDFYFPGLVDLYNGATFYAVMRWDEAGDWVPASCPEDCELTKKYVYEILGRMCHLIQDMSVPAHVHCNSHACVERQYCDYYERNAMNYHLWTAEEIYNNGGRFIYPYNSVNDPIYYLMYFMNQITDHYADGLTNGDNNYDTSFPGLSDIIPNLGPPTTTGQINDANCRAMHDVLLPLAIRATAGLMYWFAVETGQIQNQTPGPLSINISGPTCLNRGVSGTFTANPLGGSGTYINYKWWLRNDEGRIGPYSLKGNVVPNAPPVGKWIYMSQWEGHQTITMGPSYDFSLKCEVTDSDNHNATDIHSVIVGGPSLSKGQQNKTISIKMVPTELILAENYPNPFNPTTTIRFGLPEAQHVSINIYSITGKRVITLIDDFLSEGYHQVVWDGTNKAGSKVGSGIYIYEMRTKSKRLIRKMLLAK